MYIPVSQIDRIGRIPIYFSGLDLTITNRRYKNASIITRKKNMWKEKGIGIILFHVVAEANNPRGLVFNAMQFTCFNNLNFFRVPYRFKDRLVQECTENIHNFHKLPWPVKQLLKNQIVARYVDHPNLILKNGLYNEKEESINIILGGLTTKEAIIPMNLVYEPTGEVETRWIPFNQITFVEVPQAMSEVLAVLKVSEEIFIEGIKEGERTAMKGKGTIELAEKMKYNLEQMIFQGDVIMHNHIYKEGVEDMYEEVKNLLEEEAWRG